MTRRVKLQINQSGAWREVPRFDLDELIYECLFLSCAERDGAVTAMRIVADEAVPQCLMSWSAERGWESDGNSPANTA